MNRDRGSLRRVPGLTPLNCPFAGDPFIAPVCLIRNLRSASKQNQYFTSDLILL